MCKNFTPIYLRISKKGPPRPVVANLFLVATLRTRFANVYNPAFPFAILDKKLASRKNVLQLNTDIENLLSQRQVEASGTNIRKKR